ncbi:MAG TPA: hypothetical protein VJ785_13080 [Anaerolineales bacterium]|nr:hypothetical protein [Anaerolineales bacterium]
MPAKARTKTKTVVEAKARTKSGASTNANNSDKIRVVNKISPPHIPSNGDDRRPRGLRLPQYAYMKAPGIAHDFQVGDTVEVYCDHEKNKERVRGWIRGIVVQVDNKMVAVQFRSNVFLTDGWMVPDRILWYPLASDNIRPVLKKSGKREKAIPDY